MSGADSSFHAAAGALGPATNQFAADSEALIRALSETIERSHERSISYANLILAAGYAGYFGLWGLAGSYVSPGMARWSLFAMSFSLTLFVLFEVAKMAHTASAVRARALGLQTPTKNLAQLTETLRGLKEDETASSRRLFKYWPFMLGGCVVSGLIGAGILLTALLIGV